MHKHDTYVPMSLLSRKYEYEYKIIRLQKMIEREAGFSVVLERAPNGALIIPQELAKKVPNISQ